MDTVAKVAGIVLFVGMAIGFILVGVAQMMSAHNPPPVYIHLDNQGRPYPTPNIPNPQYPNVPNYNPNSPLIPNPYYRPGSLDNGSKDTGNKGAKTDDNKGKKN